MTNERSGWYIAEIVLRFQDANSGDLVHVNTILISADSDAEAFEKSVSQGRAQARTYRNTDGKSVTVSFVGLRNLFYIYDGLTDGAELMYEELEGLTPDQIEALPRQKHELAVFSASEDASMQRQIR